MTRRIEIQRAPRGARIETYVNGRCMAVGATMTTDAARLCAEEMAHTLVAAVIDHTASDEVTA